jgi:K+-transporting ATPase ATPase C chain
MKTIKSVLPKAGMIFLIFTLLCGVIYTGVVTGIAQLIFSDNANGSIVEVDGKKYGWGSNIQMKPICGGAL